jgi:hypothetical protein
VRALRIIGYGTACLVAALSAAIAWSTYTTFFRYSADIDTRLERLTPTEWPSHEFYEAALRVHHHGVAHIAARRLLGDFKLNETRSLNWQYRYAMWSYLLPITRSPEEIMALYADTMVFESHRGLAAASSHYFSAPPSELSYDEALHLVVMDIHPSRYSPTSHPEQFAEALRRYQ